MEEQMKRKSESEESDEYVKIDYPRVQDKKFSPSDENELRTPDMTLRSRSMHKDTEEIKDNDKENIDFEQFSRANPKQKLLQKKRGTREPLQFGPMPKNEKVYTQVVLILAAVTVTCVMYYTRSKRDHIFASFKENVEYRHEKLICGEKLFTGGSHMIKDQVDNMNDILPGACGRFVMDNLISNDETQLLFDLFSKIFEQRTEDMNQYAYLHLKCKEFTTSIYRNKEVLQSQHSPRISSYFTTNFDTVFNTVVEKVRVVIREKFNIRDPELRLVEPTFASGIDNKISSYTNMITGSDASILLPQNHYTAIIFLNDHLTTGGTHVFVNPKTRQSVIEPKRNRLIGFSSGSENYYLTRNVTSGHRFTLTLSFSNTVPDIRSTKFHDSGSYIIDSSQCP